MFLYVYVFVCVDVCVFLQLYVYLSIDKWTFIKDFSCLWSEIDKIKLTKAKQVRREQEGVVGVIAVGREEKEPSEEVHVMWWKGRADMEFYQTGTPVK